ncbi:hypothetical protein D1007_13608 [Hordeum vulgare]|nr:hypothetical protein D1007_13608 [Hordeum vulgare]
MRHHVLVYHYCLPTTPYEHFARFVNILDYRFAMMDTTNNLKVLKTSGLVYQKLGDILGQYRVWGNDKLKGSLVDLVVAIIDPSYIYMKVEFNKIKPVWHKAWVKILDEHHLKHATKDMHTCYEMYRRIVDMRKCLLLEDEEGSIHK